MSSADISRREKYSRCVALEDDYVHQVYEKIGKDLAQAKDPLENTVQKFLDGLEPGSLVADVGCGDGKHLRNTGILSFGADSSSLQASLAYQRCQEALLGDNLRLPFRGNAFDAVLSVGVIHHFTTKERRVEALKELARILKIGGRVLIAVQKHSTQISQDVLMPWFDVPKDKKITDQRWFEQDSGEYELEDDKDEEDEDDDSISLPSSDEDDTPLTNYAKMFPPQSNNAKQGWNSERHSRSLDYDYSTSSHHVPNSKQLVQTNACYAFVRKALKRFSSVNATDEDSCFMSELEHRVDSAVPPSPSSGQEQRFEDSNCSSLNIDEMMQKTINDNFIELLNIDDDQNTSNFSYSKDLTNSSLCNESSDGLTNKNKGTLIRSLSDMFKNMNSLWSSKGTKSCSDLKCHAALTECNFKGKDDCQNRLVRSKTTATCNPEFDYVMPLEDIEELDMSVSEANKIVNDFLESSMPRIESVKSKNTVEGKPLIHSDIVNGNTSSLNNDELLKTKAKLGSKIQCRENYDSNKYFFVTNEADTAEESEFNLREKIALLEAHKYDFVESARMSIKPRTDLYFRTKTYRESKKLYLQQQREKFRDIKVNYEEYEGKMMYERSILKAKLKEKYSFLFDDDVDDELPEKTETGTFYSKAENYSLCVSTNDEKYAKTKTFVTKSENEGETFLKDTNLHSLQTFYAKSNDMAPLNVSRNTESSNKKHVPYENDTINKSCGESTTQNIPFSSKIEFSDLYETGKVPSINQTSNSKNSTMNCNDLQNIPSRLQKLNHNNIYQKAPLKTLGPFYDIDNDFNCIEGSTLSSYYSMPELHALSEFYNEYSVYQNYFVNNAAEEIPDLPENSNLENSTTCSLNEKEFFKLENDKLNSKASDIFHDKLEKQSFCQPEKHISNSFEIKNRGECDSTLTECKALFVENTSTNVIPTIGLNDLELCGNFKVGLNKKETPISCEDISTLNLNNVNKCASFTCLNSSILYNQSNSGKFSLTSRGILRSYSVCSLPQNSNLRKYAENRVCSNISSSHPSLACSPFKKRKSNLLIGNQKRQNLDSSNLPLDHSISKSFSHQNSIKDNFCTNQKACAFSNKNRDFVQYIPKSPTIKERLSNKTSLDEIKCLKHVSEKVPEQSSNNIVLNNEVMSKSLISSETSVANSNTYEDKSSEMQTVKYRDNTTECANAENCVPANSIFLNNYESVKPFSDPTDENSKFDILTGKLSIQGSKELSNSVEASQSGTDTHGFLDNRSNMIHAEKTNSIESTSKSIPEKNSDKTHDFSCNDISSQETLGTHLHKLDSFVTKRNTDNGAILKTPFPNKNSAAVSNQTKNVDDKISSAPTEILKLNPSSSAEKSDCKQIFETTESDNENINYNYGRIREEGAVVVRHRYHHLFQEEELDNLIENYVCDLHILTSFHEESHWCIIAEKVRVWSI